MSDPISLADELFRRLRGSVEEVAPLLEAAKGLSAEERGVFIRRLSALVDAEIPPDKMLILKFLLSILLAGVFPQINK